MRARLVERRVKPVLEGGRICQFANAECKRSWRHGGRVRYEVDLPV